MAEDAGDALEQLSAALSARAAAARPLVVAIAMHGRPLRSGTLWRKDLVVASEQALPRGEEAEVTIDGGARLPARLAGRDPGTNVAVLRLEGGPEIAPPPSAAEPLPGALALAFGANGEGGVSIRMGVIRAVGPAWHSRAGGRIDRRIALDLRLGSGEEGGPVLDAGGRLLGISTLGPRRRALVLPAATVERVLEPLLTTGRVARGWLGAAVQPVLVPEALRVEIGQSLGLMVIAVNEDGPAAQAGVLMGDILVALDGTALGSPAQLAQLLGAEAVGRQVQIRLIRAGVVQTLAAAVGARPAR
ncbi:MAG: S1C family serine protease [Stellaceae bacterium]